MLASNARLHTALFLGWIVIPVLAGAQVSIAWQEPSAGFTPAAVAGLYQMLDPRGYADPLAAATYLRLLPDKRSRLEGVIVSDVQGAVSPRVEVGPFAHTPWEIRNATGGAELCFEVAGKLTCGQMEREPATGDLLLFSTSRPRGRADLRLHRIDSSRNSASS
jgi:hypothetical protein